MPTTRPFAYNTGPEIPLTTQVGDLAIGYGEVDYSSNYGGVQWWMGPDEDLGYVIAKPIPSGNQPNPFDIPAYVGFERSEVKTEESFLSLVRVVFGQTFETGNQALIWLNTNGYWTSFVQILPTPTPSITPTQTITPTITQTPTLTPTPSTTPPLVTGYPFNLVALPYNFPVSGTSIMNNDGGIASGSTNINALALGSRGFYFNAIDSNGIDRTNYFSGFTGQSITITFIQTGSTAIYSGDTNSFKQWTQSPMGSGFVFGSGIGVPPSNTPSGTAVLTQSATTLYNFGIPVYVSLVINPSPTPTPTPSVTSTQTQTPSVSQTQTPTATSTLTPTTTPTQTPTQTLTPSVTPTNTLTPTNTPSVTPTKSTAVTFSQTFTGGVSPGTTIENAWTTFRSQLTGTYTKFDFTSSNGQGYTGITDAVKVQQIADAIRTGTGGISFNTTISGVTWFVGCCACRGGTASNDAVEFANVGLCSGSSTAALRPFINNLNWGGIGSTVGASTQTLTLKFY